MPLPTRIDWLPWCLTDAADTSPHPGALPPIPAGGAGWLIAPERGHLADCQSDLQAVSRWLARQKDNPLTLEAYRHEIERYLLWLGIERGKALSEATGEDISLFSEFCHARMGDLIPIRRPTGVQWWWQVRGKHRREADAPDEVPIPPALIAELSRYRASLGLSPLPEPGETTPMVLSLYPKRDGWAALNRSTLWRLIKAVFGATAEAIAADDPEGAAHLRAASPHWLRHTGITHRLDEGLGLKEAQALSRHRSLKDLGTYAHADRDALYARVAGWRGLETPR
ncbi:MAG: hypothetical protein ACLFTD_11550 [Halochromatium sp.]